ncbi:MAG: DnaJ C-terminal domain-containing protein [Betaproteobacteria bacterium]
MKFRDYYETLGVERTATVDDIKRAYRKLARKFHPDVSKEKDAEARFKEIGEAYAVLKDPEKRAAYDEVGQQWKGGQDFTPPPGWDAGFEFSGGDAKGGERADFSDFFESLFGRAGAEPRQRRHATQAPGDDHHAKVLVELGDAYTGAKRSLSLRMPTQGDDGRVAMRERTLEVTIPKGIREGRHLRLKGQGGAGYGGGPPGDLYLEVAFAPHRLYRVEGADVTIDLPLAPWEAEIGASVRVPTPAGDVELAVPPHSSGGRKLRIKGRGIPGNLPGDFYAVVTIALPRADTDTTRDAYRAFAQAFDFDPRGSLRG